MTAKKPEYRAFSEEPVTDGLVGWNRWTVDFSKGMTPDDWQAFKRAMDAGSFSGRVEKLERNLAGLAADSPSTIQMHAAEIRKILDECARMKSSDAPRAVLDRLHDAEQIWITKIMILRDVVPAAVKGRKFKPGRDDGAVGPIRAAVRRLLTKYPALKNAELWKRISAKPPRGWRAFDNNIGRYFEGPTAGDVMAFARFANVCSSERKLLRDGKKQD